MKIKGWVYFVGFFILVGSIVWALFSFVAGPKFVTLFKPSGFSRPQEVGAVVKRRLFIELNRSKITVIGIEAYERSHWEAVQGFLEVMKAEKTPDQPEPLVIIDEAVKVDPQFIDAPIMSFKLNFDDLVSKLKSAQQPVLLITSTLYSSHLMHNGFVQLLEEQMQTPVMSLTWLQMARTPEGEAHLKISCVGAREEGATYGQLGCLARTQSRRIQNSKKPITDSVVSMMEQTGLNDYIIYQAQKF